MRRGGIIIKNKTKDSFLPALTTAIKEDSTKSIRKQDPIYPFTQPLCSDRI